MISPVIPRWDVLRAGNRRTCAECHRGVPGGLAPGRGLLRLCPARRTGKPTREGALVPAVSLWQVRPLVGRRMS